jgi:hypothetical protein
VYPVAIRFTFSFFFSYVEGKMVTRIFLNKLSPKRNARNLSMYVASHNIMDGLYINKLLRHYQELKDKAKDSPIFLCIQENVIYNDVAEDSKYSNDNGHTFGSTADVISNCLSPEIPSVYKSVTSTDTRLSTIYNTHMFELLESETLYLPKLEKLSISNRIAGFKIEDKTSLVTRFKLKNYNKTLSDTKENIECSNSSSSSDDPVFTIINFHLDAAGDNKHRTMQFQEIADILHAKESFVLCGDTNLFTFFPKSSRQYDLLNDMVKPVALKTGAGIIGDCSQPTHFFSRANEPKLGHQVVYKLGKLGLDIPGCYDVLISNMVEDTVGQIDTPFSDHNLIYAKFSF